MFRSDEIVIVFESVVVVVVFVVVVVALLILATHFESINSSHDKRQASGCQWNSYPARI